MRICLVSPLLAPAMRELGHELAVFWPRDAAVFDLEKALGEQGFAPDLILQEETLGPRVLLAGLDAFDCPKLFWSLDTHLNRHWHRHYARCFDAVVTPHLALWRSLPWALPPAWRLPFPAPERPWVPHAQRRHAVSFVGRINQFRPRRAWLARFLTEACQAAIVQDIPFPEMLDLYADTRLAPNEAIQAEVNFRVTEAAGCGCLVLSQNIGEDQDALLEPGREIVLYEHVLDLRAHLERFQRDVDAAESMARQAWERVQREHLARHRARTVLELMDQCAASPLSSAERARAWRLARWELTRGGQQPGTLAAMARPMADQSDDPEVAAALLETAWLEQGREAALALAAQILAHPLLRRHAPLAAASSAVMLAMGRLDLARQCLLQQAGPGGLGGAPIPDSPAALLQAWAAILTRQGLGALPGRRFEAGRHLPACAADCLFLALHLAPGDLETTRRLEAVLAQCGGYEHIRLGLLSDLSLRKREDWRAGQDLALANLRAFRLREGMEELLLALRFAAGQGKQEAFQRRLRGQDPGGLAAAALMALA